MRRLAPNEFSGTVKFTWKEFRRSPKLHLKDVMNARTVRRFTSRIAKELYVEAKCNRLKKWDKVRGLDWSNGATEAKREARIDFDLNELAILQHEQHSLLRKLDAYGIVVPNGLRIPHESFAVEDPTLYPDVILTDDGEVWGRGQIRREIERRIEFWLKIIMPTLALVVSLISLVVSLANYRHGHH